MHAYDIILKKRDGEVLSPDEISFMVNGYLSGNVPDSQMSSWLMAIFFRGMNDSETAVLTSAMIATGKTLDLSMIPGIKVDKHSTGGVGDKTTLVLIPLLAAADIPMVKMAGRSLGYTGGTIDKLESIPGFHTSLSIDQIVAQVNSIGLAITSQTSDLVPGDKSIYALRDITATIESIPLIASSIMSKKIAAGADAFVLDVKVGSGAFMKDISQGAELARSMVDIGNSAGKMTAAFITDMDQPLGNAVGNVLEVKEAISALKGNGPDDLVELCKELGGMALMLAKKCNTFDLGKTMISELIETGKGIEKLKQMIKAQNGDPNAIDDLSILPSANVMIDISSLVSGYIVRLDALSVAKAEAALMHGRGNDGKLLDPAAGIYLRKKRGDYISSGDIIADVYASDIDSANHAADLLRSAYEIADEKPVAVPLVHERIYDYNHT